MDLGLQGKKALVTGGSRGIGRAIAELLADEGANVAICARNLNQVNETVEALKNKGVKAFGKSVDIADGSALGTWITESAQALGGIDILISNPSAFASNNTESDWESNFRVDLLGAQRSVEEAKPFLLKAAQEKGDAAIVFIASGAALETERVSPYGAMKAALIHFAKGVARTEAPYGIRSNVVSPGTVYFEGGFWQRVEQHNPEMFQQFMGRNPMGRMGTAQEIARAAVFLASPASSFTTGNNMVVEGTYTTRVPFKHLS
jgi:3-oxoacyl-[acyl-carrier protein] reductase